MRTRIAALAATALAAGTLPAQDTIRAVVIERGDVYSADEERANPAFALSNALHARTREHVVRRELLLRPGMPMDSARAAETARNLRRLGVFTEVQLDTVRAADGGLVLRVRTQDAWTTRPIVGFRSVGGQTLATAGVIESNIAGLGGTLDLRFIDDPDRRTARSELVLPRVVADRITLGASYTAFSDGRTGYALAEQPWVSLSARTGWRLVGSALDARVLRFRDGTLAIADSLTRRFSLVGGEIGRALRASPAGYLRVGVAAQLRREDFAPREATTIGRTVTGAVTPWIEASRARFVVTRNYRLLGPQEDVDLSTAVRVGTAIAPRAWGYDRTGVGPVVVARTGMRLPHGFALATARASGLASAGAVDSGTVTVAGTVVLQPDARQTLVAYANAGWDRNPWPGEEFDLGLVRGPRAFPLHAFTGDRQRFAMVEYRYTLPWRIARTGVLGLAAFAESGGAWFAGDRPRWGHDAGVGLRLGSTRTSAALGAGRIDLAWRRANDRLPAGAVVVVGSGFPFDFMR